LAYQVPGFVLLLSALIGATVVFAVPHERLWALAGATAGVVTLGMLASYIALSI
jgi:hypothetical protein